MTILDACVTVLEKAQKPLTADQIHDVIAREKLYEFSAKDPRSIVRGTLRKHLRTPGPHKVVEVSKGTYRLA